MCAHDGVLMSGDLDGPGVRAGGEVFQQMDAESQSLGARTPILTYTRPANGSGSLAFVSQDVEQVLGFSAAEIAGEPDFLARRVHEEDRERVQQAWARASATGEPLSMAYQLQAHDGQWHAIREEAVLVRDAAGLPDYWQGVLIDLTQLFAVATALDQSERRYLEIFNDTPVMHVITRNEHGAPIIEECNTPFLTTLGYERTEVIGRSIADFFSEPSRQRLLGGEYAAALEGKMPEVERELLTSSGELLTCWVVARPELGPDKQVRGTRATFIDISSRKAAELALRESEERFRAAFDHAPIGLAIVSSDSSIQEVNRALCDMIGYPEAELLGAVLDDFTYPEDREDDAELAARLWAGDINSYQREKRYVHRGGRLIWVEITVSAVDVGARRYAIYQIQDVSGRRRLDLERATMLASERAYTRQLRELAAMRADLSAMVAHELRAPVAALRMMTSVLATQELDRAAAAEMIAAIAGQIDQLDRITNDVSLATSAERDDLSIQLHAVPLAVVLSGASSIAQTILGDHPFTVSAIPDVHVWCDPARVTQVLTNLLGNVSKHTPPGTPVELRATQDGSSVEIEVIDYGPGIAADDLPVIFQKFARGQDAGERQAPGLGLGLYVSQQIVQAHGSELTARSNPDGGATFAFTLRVAR